jgi:hypothetical protein
VSMAKCSQCPINFISIISHAFNPFSAFLRLPLWFRLSFVPQFLPVRPLLVMRNSILLLSCTMIKILNYLLTATGSSLNSLECHRSPFLAYLHAFTLPHWILEQLLLANWISSVWLTETTLESVGGSPQGKITLYLEAISSQWTVISKAFH